MKLLLIELEQLSHVRKTKGPVHATIVLVKYTQRQDLQLPFPVIQWD